MSSKIQQKIIMTLSVVAVAIVLTIVASLSLSRMKTANEYKHPEDERCRTLDQFMDITQPWSLSVSIFDVWHSKIKFADHTLIDTIEQPKNAAVQAMCPSTVQHENQLIVDKHILARSYQPLFSADYFVYDCHDNPLFYVDFKIGLPETIFKDYYKVAEIRKPDVSEVWAYVGRKGILEEGFTILDNITGKVVASVDKKHFSLKYVVDIVNHKHVAADPNLILMMLGKFRNKRITKSNDGEGEDYCNSVYDIIWIIYIMLWVCIPISILWAISEIYNTYNEELEGQQGQPLVEMESKDGDSKDKNKGKELAI